MGDFAECVLDLHQYRPIGFSGGIGILMSHRMSHRIHDGG